MASREPIAAREVDRALRRAVFLHFIEDARAPDARQLAARVGVSLYEVPRSLHRISDAQDIVLSPSSDTIWMAHPFSAVLTEFQVMAGGQRYWANCAWDALGVAVLLDSDADIQTHCPDCGLPLRIEVRHGQVEGHGVLHFLVPPSHFRDNIAFTCATTLLFRSAGHVERWCRQRRLSPGSILPLRQSFELTRRAVGDRLSPDFRPRPLSENLQIYREVGLTDEFWQTHRLGHAHGGWSVHSSAGVSPRRSSAAAEHAAESATEPDYRLTPRELEILHLLAAARRQKQIAHELGLSPHTVDTHIRKIYAKLQVRSRAAANTTAIRAGLV